MGTTWNIGLPSAEWYDVDDYRLESLINEVVAQKVVSLDTETTGLDIIKSIPLFWSLSWKDTPNSVRRVCMPAATLHKFYDAFADSKKEWIFANAKYDTHILANVGINLKGKLIDSQVMHALLYEEQPHGLKEMAKQILGWRWNDFKDTFGHLPKGASYGDVLLECARTDLQKLVEYAANDAYATLEVYFKLKQELENSNTFSLYPDQYATLWDYFYKIEAPFTRVLWKCERNGIKVDAQRLASIDGPMKQEIDHIERQITALAGRPLNPKSPKQLVDYFIGEKKLKPLSFTKGGKTGVRTASVNAEFLEYYADSDPMAKLLVEHRDLSKMYGTYVVGLQERMDSSGRVHTRFNQDVARTGRLSSSDPNLQNIPRPEGDKHELRGAFIADDGYTLIVADYEALEMRLLAAAALEQDMIDIFLKGWDIHMGNAALVFGPIVAKKFNRSEPFLYEDFEKAKKTDKKVKAGELAESELTDWMHALLEARQAAKTIGFGLNYGMKAKKLAARLKCSEAEAQLLMDQYMGRYPAVQHFYDEAVEETRLTGYAFTALGRRRFLPEIMSGRDDERWRAERQSGNLQIQGTAADVAKMAMILCDEANLEDKYGCRMLLQVHDELVFECPSDPEAIEGAKSEIKEWMEHPFHTDLAVPLTISMGTGREWSKAK